MMVAGDEGEGVAGGKMSKSEKDQVGRRDLTLYFFLGLSFLFTYYTEKCSEWRLV